MIFANRKQAGQKLASLLLAYKGKKDVLVLGLARGGVVVAFEIAKALHLPLNLLIPRKITASSNPELALGAVSEDGEVLLNEPLIESIGASGKEMKEAIERAKREIAQKSKTYRTAIPLGDLKGKTIILVDDGVATGLTMLAEIQSLRQKKVHRIIAASPVSSTGAWQMIRERSDEAVCPEVRDDFFGISEFYADFSQVEDSDVLAFFK